MRHYVPDKHCPHCGVSFNIREFTVNLPPLGAKKKYVPCILKYVPCISKYKAHIFTPSQRPMKSGLDACPFLSLFFVHLLINNYIYRIQAAARSAAAEPQRAQAPTNIQQPTKLAFSFVSALVFHYIVEYRLRLGRLRPNRNGRKRQQTYNNPQNFHFRLSLRSPFTIFAM